MKSPCDKCSLHPCVCQIQNTIDCSNVSSSMKKAPSQNELNGNITPENKNNFRYPVNSPLRTIRESPCSRNSTPHVSTPLRSYKKARNPFDVEVDSLQMSSFSPSVFAMTKRSEESSSFRWSIEQLAVLKPADIDETSQQDVYIDWDKEVKAQKAIDAFFSKNHIVPSPWAPATKYNYSVDNQGSPISCKSEDCHDSSNAKTVSTQTMVTVPPSIDLMSLLRPFCTYQVESVNDSANSSGSDVDMLSTSSLRRKLFINDNDELVTYNKIENLESPHCLTPEKKTSQQIATPASDHFSSSPITPRNFSLSMNCPGSTLSSPNISPIKASSEKLSSSNNSVPSTDEKFSEDKNEENSFSSRAHSEDADQKVSQQSVIMQSVGNIATSSFCSTEVEFYDPCNGANLDEENHTSFPDSISTNRDTGYLTGSMSSAPSMNVQQTSSCGPLRTTPVTELLGTCAITKVQHINSNTDDSRASTSNIDDISLMSTDQGDSQSLGMCVPPIDLNFGTWLPNHNSTPSKNYNF